MIHMLLNSFRFKVNLFRYHFAGEFTSASKADLIGINITYRPGFTGRYALRITAAVVALHRGSGNVVESRYAEGTCQHATLTADAYLLVDYGHA